MRRSPAQPGLLIRPNISRDVPVLKQSPHAQCLQTRAQGSISMFTRALLRAKLPSDKHFEVETEDFVVEAAAPLAQLTSRAPH